MIAAKQFYIEHGNSPNPEKLQSLLLNFWMSTIMSKMKTSYFTNYKIRAQKVKEDIVSYAKNTWPLLFSRFYEAYKFAGPSLPKNDGMIAVNWTGVYVVDDQEQVLLELSFPEITEISSSRSVRLNQIKESSRARSLYFAYLQASLRLLLLSAKFITNVF